MNNIRNIYSKIHGQYRVGEVGVYNAIASESDEIKKEIDKVILQENKQYIQEPVAISFPQSAETLEYRETYKRCLLKLIHESKEDIYIYTKNIYPKGILFSDESLTNAITRHLEKNSKAKIHIVLLNSIKAEHEKLFLRIVSSYGLDIKNRVLLYEAYKQGIGFESNMLEQEVRFICSDAGFKLTKTGEDTIFCIGSNKVFKDTSNLLKQYCKDNLKNIKPSTIIEENKELMSLIKTDSERAVEVFEKLDSRFDNMDNNMNGIKIGIENLSSRIEELIKILKKSLN